jgi:hypothetical protein
MTETLTRPAPAHSDSGPLFCTVRQVQLEPVELPYELGVECGELAAVIFRIRCERGHESDRPVCKFHREIVSMQRPGDKHLCRVCAEAGDGEVPITWTEIPL